MHARTLALLLALAALPSAAQPGRPAPPEAAAPADSAAAPAPSDSTAAPRLTGLLRRVAADAADREATPSPLIQNALVQASRAASHVFGSGLKVTLPPGWDGPVTAVDHGPPGERYAFRNATPGHPLAGAVLRVERVGGLDPLQRERWVRGQTTYGYNGTAPMGPTLAPLAGLALEVEGGGQGGAVVFTQRRGEMWTAQVVAPAATWRARRGEVLAALAGVSLP